MVMTDGNNLETPAAPAAVQAGPSASELAAAFVQGLKQAGMVVAPANGGVAAPAKKTSQFESLMQSIRSNEDTDQSVAAVWETLGKALREDIKEEVMESGRNITTQELINERSESALDYVVEQLEDIFSDIEDDNARETVIKLAKTQLVEAVKSEDKYTQLRENIARGKREKSALRQLANEHASSISKLMKRETATQEGRGVTGIGDGASIGQVRSAAKPVAGGSVDNLSDRQLEWYNQRNRDAQSAGLNSEEAHKDALASALRLPR